ncbi:hypothetical protein MCEZEM1_03507 [Comamonadaceae bacterium]
MKTHPLCSHDNLLGVDIAEPGNVLGHRAIKQLNILRKVPNERAQLLLVPTEQICTIQPHRTGQCRPDPHEQAGQSRFARATGTDDGNGITRLNLETDLLQDGRTPTRCSSHYILKSNLPAGRGQRHGLRP